MKRAARSGIVAPRRDGRGSLRTLETMPGARQTRARGRPALAGALLLLLIAATAPFAFSRSFENFRDYDDEGSFLLADRHFFDGAALYDEIWSFYGPLPHQLRRLLHSGFGLPVTHDAYRALTVATWCASAALLALGVFRVSGSAGAMAATGFAGALHLVPLASEPGHPQELVVLGLSSLALLAAPLPRWPRAASAALGALVAVLLLAKLNAGAFAGAAVALALSLAAPRGALRSLAVAGSLAAALALPAIAMRSDALAPEWSGLALTSLSGVALASALWLRLRPEPGLRPRLWVAVGGGLVLAASLLAALAQGSSLGGLLHGLIALPAELTRWLGSDTRFFVPPWLPLALALLCGGFALRCAGAAPERARGLFEIAAAAKLGLVLSIAAISIGSSRSSSFAALLWIGLPASSLLLVPSGPEERGAERLFPRLLLVLAASLQALYAYPVTGTQAAVATWLPLQCCALLFADALRALSPLLARGARARRLESGIAALAALALALALARETRSGLARYRERIPLGLPGAALLRVPERRAAALRWLAWNVSRHCDLFVAVPGLPSLYFWTGIPAPLVVSRERWFLDRGGALRSALLARERPCLVTNARGIRHWFRKAREREEPLRALAALRSGFRAVGEAEGWRLSIRAERAELPLELAARVAPAAGGFELEFGAPAALAGRVARLCVVDHESGEALADTQPGERAYPLALAAAEAAAGGVGAPRLPRTRVFPGWVRDALEQPGRLVRLYDAQGALLTSLPLLTRGREQPPGRTDPGSRTSH